jgi:hypothetical protein
MMNEVVVTFWGLCSLIDRTGSYEVYLPNGRVVPESDAHDGPDGHAGHPMPPGQAAPHMHVMPHVATMAIPADQIANVNDPSAWAPTSVIHHDDVQIACWDLAHQVVTFAPNPPPAVTGASWAEEDRTKSIGLHTFHPGNTARKRSELIGPQFGYALLTLASGRLQTGQGLPLAVSQGMAVPKQQVVARNIEWYPGGNTLTIESAGRRIIIKQGASISVTNVSAQASSGHEHFGLYYTLLTKPVRPTERVMVAPASTLGARTEEAWDCVPPTTGS